MNDNGAILYRGPSMIDGSPIVMVATGLAKSSRNEKTGGGLIQTWIIRDDMSPVEAVNNGGDLAICGSCPHRGEVIDGRNISRSCYVAVFQAPLSVFKSLKRGIYQTLTVEQGCGALAGKMVRLGSYGDPAAIPFDVWQGLLSKVKACTGYTHQWRVAPALKAYCMASCDHAADYTEAKASGWRTFRVRSAGEALNTREITCPASKEAGYKTTCDACKACGGQSSKAKVDVAILAHGAANKVAAFNSRLAA